MKKAFQCDFFKLLRSLPFQIVTGVMFAFSIITSISNLSFDTQLAQSMGVSQYGYDAFFMALRDTPTVTILGIVFVGVLICNDFSNRYIQTVITVGIQRHSVVVTKTVVSYITLGAVYFIYTLGRTVAQSIGLGFGHDLSLGTIFYLAACFLVIMLAHCSIIGLCVLIAFSVQSTVFTCGLSVLALVLGGNVLLSFGASTPVLGNFFKLTPFGMGKEVAFAKPDGLALFGYAVLALCYIALELIATIGLFRRAELK